MGTCRRMSSHHHQIPDLQAYGAGNYMALGLVLQQALIISAIVFLAILALWTQAGPILLLAGMVILQIGSSPE